MTKEPLIKLEGVSKHYVKNKMSIDIFDELDEELEQPDSPTPARGELLSLYGHHLPD